MNSTSSHPSQNQSTTLKSCHPERSLAESEANCQTQSKDPYQSVTASGQEKNFRITIRFQDGNAIEEPHIESREAAACESPARSCRVSAANRTSLKGTAPCSRKIQ